MITIDGSYGEGGGQILRTAVCLSVITQTPVKIINIRANRPNPGIKPQHYTALLLLKQLSQARTEGLEIGSTTLSFYPQDIKSGRYTVDVGTAGSITLICQSILPCVLRISDPLEVIVRGGTDVHWSPSWDYLCSVFLSALQRCGVEVDATLNQRGYYPKGGGEVFLRFSPCKGFQNICFDTPASYDHVKGIVHIGNLPSHVSTRMKHQAVRSLLTNNLQSDISVDMRSTLSSGAGITLWSQNRRGVIGCCELGEKGVPAETVAVKAVARLMEDISCKATVDEHLFDQLLFYLALAKGRSICLVRSISSHAETTMWLLQLFFPSDHLFSIEKYDEFFRVVVEGIG
ncbi:MAG: RNA 3'-terminal phosphate cyclase [Candidatus Thermoplasmatota archaeon]|nr:RNA 3'-terminal phosphate cyclase [Candidatus Thermoplasmatota archaeon]